MKGNKGQQREPNCLVHRQKLIPEQRHHSEFHLTNQDTQFLRALKISVEEQSE